MGRGKYSYYAIHFVTFFLKVYNLITNSTRNVTGVNVYRLVYMSFKDHAPNGARLVADHTEHRIANF